MTSAASTFPRGVAVILSGACLLGCVADIGADSPQGASPSIPRGATSPGGPGASNGGARSPGSGGAPGAAPTTPVPAGARRVVAAELRRLNRAEYDNTVRDLLGIDLRLASAFPDDGANFGFDNNANSLTTSGYLLELYLGAARRLVDAALATPEARLALVPCDLGGTAGKDCAARVLRDFARRAFRRPPSDDELRGLTDIAARHAEAGRFDNGVAVAMRAVLVSPSFLFRVENEVISKDGKPVAVSDFELATRLSYFLWSSMPDEPLFGAAADKKMQDPAILEAQVKRMLADPRARALVDNFGGQWLSLRLLDGTTPNAKLYPDFNDDLRASMRKEVELFFRTFITENRDVADLVLASDVFVDRRLAKHYGAPAMPPGATFERASALPARGGLLRQAGWLTLTSKPTRTSAVVRGESVLSHLMCNQPPPPPPGVEGFPTEDATRGLTQAQVLAQHRARPECASCHAAMDVIGLAFENYDPVGRWRDRTSDGVAISSAGVMPDGRPFATVNDLVRILGKEAALGPCVTEKLFTYALGRGVGATDQPYLEDITRDLGGQPRRFGDLMLAITRSDLLRKRSPQTKEN